MMSGRRFKHYVLYPLLVIVAVIMGVFCAMKTWRDPDLSADYIRDIRATQNFTWEDNGYFALIGLNAPVDVKDSYAYGRAAVVSKARRYEALKKENNYGPAYSIPDIEGQDLSLEEAEAAALSFDVTTKEGADAFCFSLISQQQKMHNDCDTPKNDLKQVIARNKIIWKRFDTLPDHKNFSKIPTGFFMPYYSASDFMTLAAYKTADIAERARHSDADRAFKEWRDYMMLYRAMVNQQDTGVAKAIYMVVLGRHIDVFETILHSDPGIAKKYEADIAAAFKPEGISLYRGHTMMRDDWASYTESALYSQMTPANAFLNDAYHCIQIWQGRITGATMDTDDAVPCDDRLGPRTFFHAIMMPGTLSTNFSLWVLLVGQEKMAALIPAMRTQDAKMRMALLATHILRDKTADKDISEYISNAPDELKNPATHKAFSWDPVVRKLSFTPLDGGAEKAFYLP